MKTTVGARIKELMKQRGMNQTELARESGVSQPMISKIIRSYRRGDTSTIRRIETALGAERGSLSKQARTLRDVLQSCETDMYKKKFAEAEALARSIFAWDSGYVSLPYFTEHGEDHCKYVEQYLSDIIWGEKEDSRFDFEPTAEEAMYLLSAAWLHDIGMMYGIFAGEAPEHLQDDTTVASLRESHEFRTAKYIFEKWKKSDGCSWSEKEKAWLSNICVYHRRKHPIESFEPFDATSMRGRPPIRLGVLAALTRLADVCHVSQSRAPGPLRVLYRSLGVPQDAVCHWEKSRLISEVYFDHIQRKIIFSGQCPAEFSFYLGSFDLMVVASLVCQYVEAELFGVQKILSRYPNICFSGVEDNIDHITALDYVQKQQFLSMWPYLLDKPTSSCETAAALVQILLFALDEAKETRDSKGSWRDTIRLIMNETQKSHPVDFMIRNLCRDVQGMLLELADDAKSANEIKTYLEAFLKEMEENNHKMAESARELVARDDVLMIHGYGSNTAKFLDNAKSQYGKKPLYVIECSKPMEGIHLRKDENQKVVDFTCRCGFKDVKFLSLGALAQTLKALKGELPVCPCKILLGTHGVLGDEAFLCKVGSYMIVKTAKEFRAPVIAFAEKTKFITNWESYKEVTAPRKLFSLKVSKPHLQYPDVKCLTPRMDFVPRELVDLIVTEEGVLSGKDWGREKKILSKTREIGEG